MSMTMEQVVTQLQQEFFFLRAQVAAEFGLADAVRKDTTSLIHVKGPCRSKEFIGHGQNFQQWSKKTEAFFAGVIMESEMMLEWAGEQATEIRTTANDLEFLPTDTNVDRSAKLESLCCSRCIQRSWLTLSPIRGRTR